MILASKLARRHIINSIKLTRITQLFGEQKKKESIQDALIERKEEVKLMQDVYDRVKMKGLEERQITGVDSFQREILLQNKFDLFDPKIEPKIASLSTTVGLQIDKDNYLAQINLGKIKVKKQNEIFLSQVDPYNIPEYYDIVFDYEKQMSLVGKRIQTKQQSGQNIQDSEMKISTRKAFQQKSSEQLMKETFGVQMLYKLNSRMIWKSWLLACILCYFIYNPVIFILKDLYQCLESIQEIEKERIKHLKQLKKEGLINVLIQNQEIDFA